MAHLLYNGRNHYAALRNPPTDWTLQTKTDDVIGGPQPYVATGNREAPEAANLQRREERQSTRQGHAGGPKKEREDASYRTRAGRPETERRNCKLFGEAEEWIDSAARQWTWRREAPTCNQRHNAMPARPASTRQCGGCGEERARCAYSVTQLAAPAHVAAGCLSCPPLRGPAPEGTRKTRALREFAKTEFP